MCRCCCLSFPHTLSKQAIDTVDPAAVSCQSSGALRSGAGLLPGTVVRGPALRASRRPLRMSGVRFPLLPSPVSNGPRGGGGGEGGGEGGARQDRVRPARTSVGGDSLSAGGSTSCRCSRSSRSSQVGASGVGDARLLALGGTGGHRGA